jgi:peptide/nickel transport system substrate-binding protein
MGVVTVRRKVFALALVLGIVATACGGGSSGGGTKQNAQPAVTADPNATIRIASTEDTWGLGGTGTKSYLFMYETNFNIYEPLIYLAPDYSLKPALATSWALQPDGKTWRFTLRRGVTFNDGTPFTADDVVWTWGQRQFDGKTLSTVANTLYPPNTPFNPDAVKKVDDFTVDFTPAQPNNRLPEQIVHPEGAIVKKGTNNDTAPYAGTGPFKVVSYTAGQSFVAERNDNYWGDKAKVKRIEVQFIPDPQTRLQALKSGQADMIFELPPDAVKTLQSDPNFKVVHPDPGRNHLIYVNITPGRITADQTIREAISYALDRQAYVNVVLEGNGDTGRWMAPKSVLGTAANDVAAIPRDLGRARKLLDDAGWKVGADGIRAKGDQRLSVTLLGSNQIPDSSNLVIQSSLKDVGIDVRILKTPDAATRNSLYNSGKGDFDLDLEPPNQNDANPAFLPVLRMYSKNPNNAQFAPGGQFDVEAEKSTAAATTADAQQASANMMKILENQQYIVDAMAGVYRLYGMSKNVNFPDPNPSFTNQLWTNLSVNAK